MNTPDTSTIRAFLDDDLAAFAARAGEYARREMAPRTTSHDDDAARREARDIVAALGRDGWHAPIARNDLRAICLVREALAWASPLADAVYALQALGATPILIAGDAAQRGRWLPGIERGTVMAAFAMTERGAGSDVAAIATIATREGDGYLLEGAKTLISNAGIADLYVVFASTDRARGRDGLSAFIVPADTPGFRFAGAQVMSAPHPLGEIAFEGCRVPASSRLGAEGDGFAIGMATLDRLRATVGAAACGMAARALDEAVAHAARREQFGRTLSRFQLVQEKLGRMATELAASRLLVYRAAWEKDMSGRAAAAPGAVHGPVASPVSSAMAKAYATEAAQRIVDDAVQIVGGAGVLASHPVELLYRSVRALRIYEGTTEIQHLTIARELGRA